MVFNCVIIAWSFLHNDQENIPTFWFLLDLVNYQISVKIFQNLNNNSYIQHFCINLNWTLLQDVFWRTSFYKKFKKTNNGPIFIFLKKKSYYHKQAYLVRWIVQNKPPPGAATFYVNWNTYVVEAIEYNLCQNTKCCSG